MNPLRVPQVMLEAAPDVAVRSRPRVSIQEKRLLPRLPRFNKLAFKVAGWAAAAATLSLLAVRLYGAAPLWLALLGGAVVGMVVYGAAHHLLDARLAIAQATLVQIRRRQFENLDAAHTPRGDELNALIWQVYRTGLTLEKEIQQLKKMENYRREFLGNVSHELKTPIFAIQGFTETLLGGALEDPNVNRAFVEKIARNAIRLSNLTRDLSEISRIETGELKMSTERFDLQQVVREVVESLEMAASMKHVALRCQVPASLPRAVGDRERIRQVLTNLADNAIKYNNPGGSVEVVVRLLPSRELKVSVVDDGIASPSASTGSTRAARATRGAPGSAWPSSSTS
jgi:two-component system phosphate regulon sensor histidine kinase PhoR